MTFCDHWGLRLPHFTLARSQRRLIQRTRQVAALTVCARPLCVIFTGRRSMRAPGSPLAFARIAIRSCSGNAQASSVDSGLANRLTKLDGTFRRDPRLLDPRCGLILTVTLQTWDEGLQAYREEPSNTPWHFPPSMQSRLPPRVANAQ